MRFFTRPPLGTPLNLAHQLNRGLVGYWPMGEGAGSVTRDISVGSNHGTLTNMAQGAASGWIGGRSGGAIKFDGTNDYIDLGTSKFNHTELTVAFTLENKGTDKVAYILARNPNVDQWANLGIVYEASSLKLSANATGIAVMTYAAIANGDRFVFVLKANGTADVYRNGILVVPTSALTGFAAWNNNITNPIVIGRAGAFNNYYFNGIVGEMRIWNRALSAQEARQLYADPFCMYEQKSIFRWMSRFGSFFFGR